MALLISTRRRYLTWIPSNISNREMTVDLVPRRDLELFSTVVSSDSGYRSTVAGR